MDLLWVALIIVAISVLCIIREENNKHHLECIINFFSGKESAVPAGLPYECYEMTEETLMTIINGKCQGDVDYILKQIDENDKANGYYTIAYSGGYFKIALGKIVAWYGFNNEFEQHEFKVPISISGFYDYFINDNPHSTKLTTTIDRNEPDKLKIPVKIYDSCVCVLKFIVDGRIYSVIPYSFTESAIGEERVYFLQYPKTDDTLNIGKHMLEIVADFHPSENSNPIAENIPLVCQEVDVT